MTEASEEGRKSPCSSLKLLPKDNSMESRRVGEVRYSPFTLSSALYTGHPNTFLIILQTEVQYFYHFVFSCDGRYACRPYHHDFGNAKQLRSTKTGGKNFPRSLQCIFHDGSFGRDGHALVLKTACLAGRKPRRLSLHYGDRADLVLYLSVECHEGIFPRTPKAQGR